MTYRPKKNPHGFGHMIDALAQSQLGINTNADQISTQQHTRDPNSLIQQHLHNLENNIDSDKVQEELLQQQLLRSIAAKGSGGLMTREEAAGKVSRNNEVINTFWLPPEIIRNRTPEEISHFRKQYRIAVSPEENCPPPIESFQLMRIPPIIIEALKLKSLFSPKPIQMQGITVALSGKDMIGIAQTGGGKTLVFAVPMIALALQDEIRNPYRRKEGPFGLAIAPQRELAEQIHSFIEFICNHVTLHSKIAALSTILAIGGTSMGDQWSKLEQGRGFHCLVGTPGRICQLIKSEQISLNRCRMLCLDEADRLVTDSYQSDLQTILGAFTGPKQTILFSATMPGRVKELAQHSLKSPIIVNVGQAGTANKDITQTAIFVEDKDKFTMLLTVLKKTPPPVLVFANSQSMVDLVYEYLCIKNIMAGCIHSGIDQTNRSKAVEDFRRGDLEVLVASDLLAKGIDFELKHIEHVINFDLPDEIEFYIHRIGRTGRAGRKGIATTLFNNHSKDQLLLDLRHLLRDAGQEIPTELAELHDPFADLVMGDDDSNDPEKANKICQNCGGMGHSILYCPTLLKKQPKPQRGKMDTVQHNRD
jgi:ATP-dependent RNA helicase DDX41